MAAAKITSKGQCTIPKSVPETSWVSGLGMRLSSSGKRASLVEEARTTIHLRNGWLAGHAKRLAGRDAVDVIREMRDA